MTTLDYTCTNCFAGGGAPCIWKDGTEHPVYHAEREQAYIAHLNDGVAAAALISDPAFRRALDETGLV